MNLQHSTNVIMTNDHHIAVNAWMEEDRVWWTEITVDGVVLAYENLGPDSPAEPTPTLHERAYGPVAKAPVKKNKKRR